MGEFFRMQDARIQSLAEVLSILEKWRYSTPPDEFAVAHGELEAALKFLATAPGPVCAAMRLELATVLGNLLRDHGETERALEAYARAEEETGKLDMKVATSINALANLRTNRAILHLGQGDGAAALPDLDEALRLRELLPLDGDQIFRWGYTAGWINRGDALRLEQRPAEAVSAYERGVEELEKMEDGEAVRWRRAVAWNNRGLALLDSDKAPQARESFERAVNSVKDDSGPGSMAVRASAMLHRGDDAREVLSLVQPLERQLPEAAAVALQARHALAQRLCEEPGKRADGEDWIAETTDLVEEALELERAWETIGKRGMRGVARDLFEVGLRVYRVCQPQFLAEYILESLDPEVSPGAPGDDPGFQAAAVEALALALREATERAVGEKAAGEQEILQSLRQADARLAEWQGRTTPAHG